MSRTTKARQRSIAKDWADRFPELGRHDVEAYRLLRRVGPIVHGIAIGVGGSDAYSPVEFCCSIACDPAPGLALTLRWQLQTARGTPATIAVKWHEKYVDDSARRMREQLKIPLGPVPLDVVAGRYREFLASPRAHYAMMPYLDLVTLHAYAGRLDAARAEMRAAESVFDKWPAEIREDEAIPAIRDLMARAVAEPARVRAWVDAAVAELGLADLPSVELVA